MLTEINIDSIKLIITKDDLTDMDVGAIAYYIRPELKLGSGYGTAISTRGGPKINDELQKIGSANVGEIVVTNAGMLKSKYIIHAVGPAFQEQDLEVKYRQTIEKLFIEASKLDIESLALPMLGIGFYGIDPNFSINVIYESIKKYHSKLININEIYFVANDQRELKLLNNFFSLSVKGG